MPTSCSTPASASASSAATRGQVPLMKAIAGQVPADSGEICGNPASRSPCWNKSRLCRTIHYLRRRRRCARRHRPLDRRIPSPVRTTPTAKTLWRNGPAATPTGGPRRLATAAAGGTRLKPPGSGWRPAGGRVCPAAGGGGCRWRGLVVNPRAAIGRTPTTSTWTPSFGWKSNCCNSRARAAHHPRPLPSCNKIATRISIWTGASSPPGLAFNSTTWRKKAAALEEEAAITLCSTRSLPKRGLDTPRHQGPAYPNEGRVRALKQIAQRAGPSAAIARPGENRRDSPNVPAAGHRSRGRQLCLPRTPYPPRLLHRHHARRPRRPDRPQRVGQSTLIQVLLKQLEPQAGKVRHGTKLNIAYFDQLRAS